MILTAVMALTGAAGVNAQSSLDARVDSLQSALDKVTVEADRKKLDGKIWGRGRFLRLGYASAQTADEYGPVEKGKYSFFLTKGTTYRIPSSKAIAGMVKFGIDAVWFDAQFSKYNSPYTSLDWTSDIVVPDQAYDDEDDGDMNLNLGHMSLGLGMGVGPSVSVAPFALTSINGLKPLRISLYFHYSPTVQLYLRSQDGDTEVSTAFCNMMNFGGTLHYRAISVGIEGRWGKGKFKPLDFSELAGEELGLGTEEYSRRFASTRFYIQFAF